MNKNPEKRHTWVEAHNISKLCETYPGKYPAPSDVYFGDIPCVFSIFKDVEIDMAVMRTAIEIQQEDFDKKQRDSRTKLPSNQTYQSPFRRHDDDDAAW